MRLCKVSSGLKDQFEHQESFLLLGFIDYRWFQIFAFGLVFIEL